MKIKIIKAKSGNELCEIEIDGDSTVIALKKKIQSSIKIKVLRQRLKYGTVVLLNHRKISQFITEDNPTVELKNLGPQLPYKILFFLEYLGPLLTVPLFYFLSKNKSHCAKYGAIMGVLHFLKRELESEFVHIFGNASVPVSGSFKNFLHYWVLYGVIATGDIFFLKAPANDWPKKYYMIFAGFWAFFQFMNLKCHIVLKNLRIGSDGKVDPHKRGIPKGYGFGMVHCANYFWEILGWVTYSIMTKSWLSFVFTLAGTFQMLAWAKKKKGKLLKYFKDDERVVNKLKRKPALFPGLL